MTNQHPADIVGDLYRQAVAAGVQPQDLIKLKLGRTTAYGFFRDQARSYSAGTLNIIRMAIEAKESEVSDVQET